MLLMSDTGLLLSFHCYVLNKATDHPSGFLCKAGLGPIQSIFSPAYQHNFVHCTSHRGSTSKTSRTLDNNKLPQTQGNSLVDWYF